MVSATTFLFAALAAVASAAPTCTSAFTPTLPEVAGSTATQLPAPAATLTLKKIAIGHGIQNYTCNNTSDTASATGALAVLYDVTTFFPGTPKTGVSQQIWNAAPSALLRGTPLPLNKLAGSQYGASLTDPFPAPADLNYPPMPDVKFLGHHYFAIGGIPTFDLSAAGLKAVVKKVGSVSAPSTADKGIVNNSGAVAWLELTDNGTDQSVGLSAVYRVLTAGGNNQACSVVGAGTQSVPYTAFYWFYG